jgi:exopolysaccharide production protein ExoQ
MSPGIATIAFTLGIVGLFWLDRDRNARTSVTLWIPVIWMWIACSRPVAVWLGIGTTMDTANQVSDGSPVDRLVYSFLLVIGIAVLFARRKVAGLLRANGPILFFFFYCAISILWSDFPAVALKRWIKAVGDLVMVLIVLTDPEPLAAFKRLLARLAFVLIPLSLLFIKYVPQLGMTWNPWTGTAIFTGVTTNKNTLGVVCLCLGLAAFWRLVTAYQDHEAIGRTRQMIAHGVILAMVFWLFRLMDSMTSLSSFVMASTLFLAGNLRAVIRRPLVVHILVATMLALSAAVVFLGVSPAALRALGRNPTLTERTVIWGQMLSQVRDPVCGTGFESFWLGPRLDAIWRLNPELRPNEAHNGYLEIFLNLGWVGVTLLGFILAAGYRTVFKAWLGNDPRGNLLLAYFFAGLVFNFTEAAFFRMQAVAWLFFLFAIVSARKVFCQESRTVSAEVKSVSQLAAWDRSRPALSNGPR